MVMPGIKVNLKSTHLRTFTTFFMVMSRSCPDPVLSAEPDGLDSLLDFKLSAIT